MADSDRSITTLQLEHAKRAVRGHRHIMPSIDKKSDVAGVSLADL